MAHEHIRIIQADHTALTQESAERVEFYRRYWAIESWDPVKRNIVWAEGAAAIIKALGTTDGKVRTMLSTYPVHIEPLACGGCSDRLHINLRQEAKQALRGQHSMLCNTCTATRTEEKKHQAEEREKEAALLEQKTQAAFRAALCDDHRPEDCIGTLNEDQVRLYMALLEAYQKEQKNPAYLWWDEYRNEPVYAHALVALRGPYTRGQWGPEYDKSGPNLYELARHRLITPFRELTPATTLTRHGLINPSGYPYIQWEVQDEIDGWPVQELMTKRLSELGLE